MQVYTTRKNLGVQGHVEKTKRERFITPEQLEAILRAVRESGDQGHTRARRDHAAIFLGFHLGLRVGECAILERRHFRHLGDKTVYVSRLKSLFRIPYMCSECDKKTRVSAGRIGEDFPCPRCGHANRVRVREGKEISREPPEKALPFVESSVIDYVREYLSYIPPEQKFLFAGGEGAGTHISTNTLEKIFSTFAMKAGLSNKYSWHALRHGRGVLLWTMFHDLQLIKECLGQKSLSSTEIYIGLAPETSDKYRDAMDKVAKNLRY